MRKLVIIFILLTTALFNKQTLAQEPTAPTPVLVIIAIVDKEYKTELNWYLTQMMKIFKEYGGKPLGRYKIIEKIEGTQSPEMIAVISFKDVNTIKNMLDCENYKSLSDLRERLFKKLNIIICEELN